MSWRCAKFLFGLVPLGLGGAGPMVSSISKREETASSTQCWTETADFNCPHDNLVFLYQGIFSHSTAYSHIIHLKLKVQYYGRMITNLTGWTFLT